MTAPALVPVMDYTGEVKIGGTLKFSGAGAAAALFPMLQIASADDGPFYDVGGITGGLPRTARLRLDLLVRKLTCNVTLDLVARGMTTPDPTDTDFVTAGKIRNGQNEGFHTLLDIPEAVYKPSADYIDAFLWPRFTADAAGEMDFFLKLRPYSTWGWESVTLTSDEAMQKVEPYLFNETFIPSSEDGYATERQLVKQDIYSRLLTGGVQPDQVLSDGACVGRPSGIGPFSVPDLRLAATYGAIAHAFRKLAFSGEGFDALAKSYFKRHEDAMDAALMVLSVRPDGNERLDPSSVHKVQPATLVR